MTQDRLSLGRQGEDAAAQYLQSRGMKILERNLRTPVGEIDLVARDRNILAFVEVKTRRGTAFGSPGEAVGRHKQRQIIRTAKWYLNNFPHVKLQPRFDVVAITVHGDDLQIEHIPGAFEL
ncbi:MAG: YraN family protein [Desulfuromonadales bacterium]